VFDQLRAEALILVAMRVPLLLIVSIVCGALVGIEREYSVKPAGIRTNILICVGSTLFTLASIISARLIAGNPGDAGRISAQIVSGVGFLGAGAILREGLRITGLTTAATIWLVAAIGMIIGLGLPVFGLSVALVATLALFILGKFEFTHFPRSHPR